MLVGRYACVLDACVLHPALLKGALLWLADEGLYRPVWSELILTEWQRSLETRFNEQPEKAARPVNLARDAFPTAMIEVPPELIGGITLPDQDDRHVVAAALVARAHAIVTTNLRHFPADICKSYGIEVIHPDTFLVNVVDLDERRAVSALRRHREVLQNPDMTAEQYLVEFERRGLVQTKQRLAALVGLL
ncbi:PIN domain-containing protein [Sandaracinobacteroides hominis]|uniref:PIN domain-containing protein n=1 Tax=Sandaracinobacteroides hominis TaxID=2780086 RepID=UPI0022A7FE3E|nr:PIN domain-containing protein [Sandaracinobacteroides hominis]